MAVLKNLVAALSFAGASAAATTIAQITGDKYLSPLNGTGKRLQYRVCTHHLTYKTRRRGRCWSRHSEGSQWLLDPLPDT